jgi:hypothetical protein
MKTFKKLGLDIGYLALLTKKNVKPLSRWESKFSRGQVKALHHLGLKTNTVERKLLNGGSITELIFSTSSHYLDFYTRRFHQTPLKKDQQTVKTEGFLFGYPHCCVKNFAQNGYAENQFVGHDQEILFHWACPGCRATPDLLPYYRKTHRECRELFAARRPTVPRMLKKSLPTAALSLLFALAAGRARADDPHWYSPSAVNTSGAFLTTDEGLLLGDWGFFLDGVPHGPREALEFRALISSLPTTPSDTCCYRSEVQSNGIENCQVCGQDMNMGGWSIHNPMRDTFIFIPNMGLHYMEQGSFSYDGTENSGRVDIELLKKVLAHLDTDHYAIDTSNDLDADGLGDDYESSFGTQTNNPDSDGNQLVDGAQVAEQLIEAIAQLPDSCISGQPVFGIEWCDICGMEITMGAVGITNPHSGEHISFPLIGLHYLAHGRFAYGGTTNSGEIDAIQLANVLDILTSVPPGGQVPERHILSVSNYPNPFNAGTQIEFSLPEADRAALRIYNIKGQLVRILLDTNLGPGQHLVPWDGRDDTGHRVASGVYFCQLEYAGSAQAGKMLLLR